MNGLLGDDIDPRTQGLLALGLGLMQGRGNFGQAFGAAGERALSAYQGAQDRDRQKRMQEQQQRTLAHQQSVAEWQHEQARKQAEEAAQNQAWIRSMPGPQMQASQSALESGGGPTQANAAKIKPVSPQQDLMWGMVQRGLMTPQAYMEATRKQQPKLSKLEQMKDDSGRLRNVAVFEDGTTSVLPYGVKPEIALQSLGNRMVAIDKNETAGGASWQMGMTPGESAVDARARERLAHDQSQAARADQDVEWKQDESGAWFSFPKRLAPGAVARPMPALAPGGGMTPLRGKGAELNEGQAKANTFAARMADAESVFAQAAAAGVDRPGAIKRTAESVGRMAGLGFDTLSNNLADTAGQLTNWTQSDDQQRVENAKQNWIAAVLRKESGAAISKQEYAEADRQYFPQAGEGEKAIADKKRRREIAQQKMLEEVPSSFRRSNAAPSAPAAGAVLRFNERGELVP